MTKSNLLVVVTHQPGWSAKLKLDSLLEVTESDLLREWSLMMGKILGDQ